MINLPQLHLPQTLTVYQHLQKSEYVSSFLLSMLMQPKASSWIGHPIMDLPGTWPRNSSTASIMETINGMKLRFHGLWVAPVPSNFGSDRCLAIQLRRCTLTQLYLKLGKLSCNFVRDGEWRAPLYK